MICETQQDVFTTHLPDMTKMIAAHFKHLSPERKEEAIQNSIALAWKFYRTLALKGRGDELIKGITWYAIQQTKVGRMPQGCTKKNDVTELRRRGTVQFEAFDLKDFMGRSTPVVDQVSFRIDVPKFLDTLNDRQKALAFDLASGMSTKDVATKFGVSSGAISQFRARFKKLYEEFFAS